MQTEAYITTGHDNSHQAFSALFVLQARTWYEAKGWAFFCETKVYMKSFSYKCKNDIMQLVAPGTKYYNDKPGCSQMVEDGRLWSQLSSKNRTYTTSYRLITDSRESPSSLKVCV